MARKEELARMWERTLETLYARRPAFERDGASGYKPGLDTALALDKILNEPHRRYRIIHIAGTNGKGSVAHMLASCLQKCGYRVGLFTSPHFLDFRERIRVNGKMVSRSYVMKWLNDYDKLHISGVRPTFFELTTAMAFDYFALRNVNVAIVETGLGGRLDSTNICTPEVGVITNVDMEHQQFLGETLEQIAAEKAGIIKYALPVVVGRADGVVRDVFEKQADERLADIKFAQDKPEVLEATHVDGILRLTTKNYGIIDCELAGDYQVENVNTVLTVMNILKRLKYRIKLPAIQEGFAKITELTGLMGRWMKVDDKPLTICDSAHNPAAMERVMTQLQHERYNRLHIVMGVMADKDVRAILEQMPKAATYYFAKADTPRALPAKKLLAEAQGCGLEGNIYNNVEKAYAAARAAAQEDDIIYVGGSMYVIADLLRHLGYGEDLDK